MKLAVYCPAVESAAHAWSVDGYESWDGDAPAHSQCWKRSPLEDYAQGAAEAAAYLFYEDGNWHDQPSHTFAVLGDGKEIGRYTVYIDWEPTFYAHKEDDDTL